MCASRRRRDRSGLHDNRGVYVEVNASGVALEDVDNFRAFAVVVTGEPDLVDKLDGLGAVDGDHAFLDPEAVKRLAGDRAAGDWGANFDNMIEFARGKGWVDEAGRVRAHIERA